MNVIDTIAVLNSFLSYCILNSIFCLQCMKQGKQWRKVYQVIMLPPSMLPVCTASPCLPYSFNPCPMAWYLPRMVTVVILMVQAQVGTDFFKIQFLGFNFNIISDSACIHSRYMWTMSGSPEVSFSLTDFVVLNFLTSVFCHLLCVQWGTDHRHLCCVIKMVEEITVSKWKEIIIQTNGHCRGRICVGGYQCNIYLIRGISLLTL